MKWLVVNFVILGIVAWIMSWSDVEKLNNYFKDPKISKRVSKLIQVIGIVIYLVALYLIVRHVYVP